MANSRRRRSNLNIVSSAAASSSPSVSPSLLSNDGTGNYGSGTTHRRRSNAPSSIMGQNPSVPPGTREINAGPILENAKSGEVGSVPQGNMTVSRAIALAGIAVHAALPGILSWGAVVGLIFGGCCSNVSMPSAIAMCQTVENFMEKEDADTLEETCLDSGRRNTKPWTIIWLTEVYTSF
ncbi:golgi uridine diphosphate-N- acetylglucosamine transporter [Agyrium rufum]|nr:golgi uridine diphosphate-N- acetylglucosamine transporter [Agyrium rufum]